MRSNLCKLPLQSNSVNALESLQPFKSVKFRRLPFQSTLLQKKNADEPTLFNSCLSISSFCMNGASEPHSNPISSSSKPADFIGFSKRKREQSECDCESVGDNFGKQYKPVTNPELLSSDCLSMDWGKHEWKTLIINCHKILLQGKSYSAKDILCRLKESFTEPYNHKKLRDKLTYLRAIFEERETNQGSGKRFKCFKEKYENSSFWDKYLEMVQHPNFPAFKGETSRSKTVNSIVSKSAGPSSVNMDLDGELDQFSIEIVIGILENLDLDDDLFAKAVDKFHDKERRQAFVLLKGDGRKRAYLRTIL